MAFESISLPPSVLRELYPDTLVNTIPESSKEEIRYKGSNQKGILVLLNENSDEVISENSLLFLSGILKACGLKIEDIAIINLHNHARAYSDFQAQFKPNTAFLFGVKPGDIGLPLVFPLFQNQKFNQVLYLAAPSLFEIEKDELLKSKLWLCLRQIFSI